jgi:exoribonuclease-2
MESGTVIEYIDRQKIVCAVIQEVKQKRLRLLTESNREVNLAAGRLAHMGNHSLDLSLGRDKTVDTLKSIVQRRLRLKDDVDVQSLWEVLNSEQEWIDLPTMTSFCFNGDVTADHESAVMRAFFVDRTYFKFDTNRFYPYTVEQVEQMIARKQEQARREKIIAQGGDWARSRAAGPPETEQNPLEGEGARYAELLKGLYIFEKDCTDHQLALEIARRAGINTPSQLFNFLVHIGFFHPHENVELTRLAVPIAFSAAAETQAEALIGDPPPFAGDARRRDLTHLELMTIDGQSTLDYDDALSLEDLGGEYRLGIHIVDVGHFVAKGSALDKEAQARGSSIYMPDLKIPMLPGLLAEGLCSLKAGELRPAISIMARLSPAYDLVDYEILPSVVKVRHQKTYYDVNSVVGSDPTAACLYSIAGHFRAYRLTKGAVQITLPEVNVWLDEHGQPNISMLNRESPARMMVSEMMILANWLMARFLAERQLTAVYRSQAEPRERLYKADGGSLFQNWMQRKALSRFVLCTAPERHVGLGLEAYVTATSPIRKYFDLMTQRQIRSALQLEDPYSPEEVDHLLTLLEHPMQAVGKTQFLRNRYWLLNFLEQQVGKRLEAIVLFKRRSSWQILLTDYMLECSLPLSPGLELKPEEVIQVTLQNVNARGNVLTVFKS